jgi:hypothetical protein
MRKRQTPTEGNDPPKPQTGNKQTLRHGIQEDVVTTVCDEVNKFSQRQQNLGLRDFGAELDGR